MVNTYLLLIRGLSPDKNNRRWCRWCIPKNISLMLTLENMIIEPTTTAGIAQPIAYLRQAYF